MSRRRMAVVGSCVAGAVLAGCLLSLGFAHRRRPGGAAASTTSGERVEAQRPGRDARLVFHHSSDLPPGAPDEPSGGPAALAIEMPQETAAWALGVDAGLSADQSEAVAAIVEALRGVAEAARGESSIEARAKLQDRIRREGDRALATVLDEQQLESARRHLVALTR